MPISSNIVENLHHQISKAIGFDFPATPWLKWDWTNETSENIEKVSQAFSNRDIFDLLVWETKAAAKSRTEWLASLSDVAAKSAAFLHTASPSDIQKRTRITKHNPTSLPPEGDTVLMKVNHGFWEQVFLIAHDGYDPIITRPTAKRGFQNSYLESRFLDAIVGFTHPHVCVEGNILRFDGIQFGFSYNAGDLWNHELSARASNIDPNALRIMRGTAAGLEIFLSNFPDCSVIDFVDGAYAKQALIDGTLKQLLQDISSKVDHAAFVVPGHLAGLRFDTLAADRQSRLHVSGRLVHQAWPLALAGVGNPILQRLAAGEHVAVIVQAAVFSAMLAEYLLSAKRDLGLSGRLSLIDLGQALDILTPQTGNIWIKRVYPNLDVDLARLPLSV